MSNRKPFGNQVDTISRGAPFIQQSFDLLKQDQFVTSLGIDFKHFKAIPSPIGKNDRGDYHRNEGVDTISSNGMLYNCAGSFTATMTDNDRSKKRIEGGLVDPSQSRLVMPRFYNKNGLADGETIYLAPGDRLYLGDTNADSKVPNYQEMVYESDVDNVPMFPIVKMDAPIVDSRNQSYVEGVDFTVTSSGNIRWLNGGKNPGIDPDTNKGRVYSIRYLYMAFWYVHSLPKEVRITNVTNGGVRTPTRMAQYAVIVREYVFHQQNRGDKQNQNVPDVPSRINQEPIQNLSNEKYSINVDMTSVESDEE